MKALVQAPVFLALLLLAGCTCNRTDAARRAELAQQQRTAANGLKKMPNSRRFEVKKGSKKASIERVDVGIVLLDQKKFAAGDPDPWVTVQRKVGPHRPVKNAIWMLFKGPTDAEKEQGLTLNLSESIGFQDFKVDKGIVSIQLRGGCGSAGSTVSIYDHLVKTMEGFPQVKAIKVLGPDGTTSDPASEGNSRPACLEP